MKIFPLGTLSLRVQAIAKQKQQNRFHQVAQAKQVKGIPEH